MSKDKARANTIQRSLVLCRSSRYIYAIWQAKTASTGTFEQYKSCTPLSATPQAASIGAFAAEKFTGLALFNLAQPINQIRLHSTPHHHAALIFEIKESSRLGVPEQQRHPPSLYRFCRSICSPRASHRNLSDMSLQNSSQSKLPNPPSCARLNSRALAWADEPAVRTNRRTRV